MTSSILTYLTVDTQAIRDNVRMLKQFWGDSRKIMVMLKGGGYGVGAGQLADFWQSCGVDFLGLAFVNEALALRKAGVLLRLFVLHMLPDEAEQVVEGRLTPAVDTLPKIQALASAAAKRGERVPVHLHVDTGMTRLGCPASEAAKLAVQIEASPHLELEGLCTHLACADDLHQDAFTQGQYASFMEVLNGLDHTPTLLHVANSAGAVRFPFSECNLVRVGLAVYGLYSTSSVRHAVALQPAVSLRSKLVHIHECTAGTTVGYGRGYTVDRANGRIGVLPIGYADGLHRRYAETAQVYIGGKAAPFAGPICMDFSMIDLSACPQVEVGSSVTLFGYDEEGRYHSPEQLAKHGSTIVYELLTCLGPRVQRIYK